MNDGIIQKAFNEYRNKGSKRLDGIDGLEQELIEEIKKLNIKYYKENVVMTKFLIGDLKP